MAKIDEDGWINTDLDKVALKYRTYEWPDLKWWQWRKKRLWRKRMSILSDGGRIKYGKEYR